MQNNLNGFLRGWLKAHPSSLTWTGAAVKQTEAHTMLVGPLFLGGGRK